MPSRNTPVGAKGGNSNPINILTAKGDMLVATLRGFLGRLAVGTDGQVLTADSSQPSGVKWATAGGVAANVIAFFPSASAPSGWAEYTAARGRYIVGVPSGGTVAGTIGSAMTDLQDLVHTHTGPSHDHPQRMGAGSDPDQGSGAGIISLSNDGIGDSIFTPVSGASVVYGVLTGVQAGGTGATGTAATSIIAPHIQLFTIQKS